MWQALRVLDPPEVWSPGLYYRQGMARGIVTSVRLPADERERADQLARALGVPRNLLVRAALNAAAAAPEQARQMVEAFTETRP